MKQFLMLCIGCFLICSCASKKEIIYLQNNTKEDIVTQQVSYKMPVFKPDDRLTISITSLNSQAASPYNLSVASFNTGGITANGNQQLQSYVIDQDGYIGFPQLGKLEVKGMTRVELEQFLEKKLKPFLPDAKANVQLVNFRISVLGEVNAPGEYVIDRDRITILQALALSRDLTIHGKRDDIMVVRESEGELIYINLDLRSKEITQSPAFYLQQNDVVYVAPNGPRVNGSATSPTTSYIVSATSLLITIISLLTR